MNRQNFILAPILLVHLLLMSSAFFVPHMENDEVIYKTLMVKTSFSLKGYTLRGSSILANLPSIYDTPLFFHPPIFTLLGKVVTLVAGETGLVAISVVASLGTTLVIYLIGRLLYEYKVGLVASALWVLNPLQLFVSQRIWLGALMVFFICLTIYFYLKGVKKGFLYPFLAGLWLLLGVLTKYPAVLTAVPVFFATCCYSTLESRFKVAKLLAFSMPLLLLSLWFYYFYTHTGGALFLLSKPTAGMVQAFPCVRMVLQRPFYFFITQSFLTYPIYIFAFFAVKKYCLKKDLVMISWVLVYFIFMTAFGLTGGGFTLRYALPAYPALSLLSGKFVMDHIKNFYLLALFGCFVMVGFTTSLINYGNVGAVDVSNLFEGCYSGCSCR